jgi:hypothetical protein
MGIGSSAPAAPPAPQMLNVSPADLASMLSGQSTAQRLAVQAAAAQQYQSDQAARMAAKSSGGGWSSMMTFFVIISVVCGAAYGVYRGYTSGWFSTELFETQDGTNSRTSTAAVPRSVNGATGLEFSYAWWMVVDDWSYKLGKLKHVWVKGDTTKGEQCPGVYLSATDNSMQVWYDTFKKQKDGLTIANLPAQKWFHVALVLHDENIVDVFINGQLKRSHKLAGVVKQNDSKVTYGVDGGFQGKIAGLRYFNYRLSDSEIQQLMAQQPSDTTSSTPANGYPKPPYFGASWFS